MKRNIFLRIINTLLSLVMALTLIFSLLSYDYISWNRNVSILHSIVIIIFGFEFIVRIINEKNKIEYIKMNTVDLFAIIPMFFYLKLFRIIGLGKILDLTQLVNLIVVILISIYLLKFNKEIKPLWRSNRISYMLLLTSIVILIGALLISIVENISLGDALWWSFVTFTTVGYGDVTLYTTTGRIVGVVLMIIGIGVIGVLTSTIAVMMFFGDNANKRKASYKDELVQEAIDKLKKFDQLTYDDLDQICIYLKALKKEEK